MSECIKCRSNSKITDRYGYCYKCGNELEKKNADLRAKLESAEKLNKGLLDDYYAKDREVTKYLNKCVEIGEDRDEAWRRACNPDSCQTVGVLQLKVDGLRAQVAVMRGAMEHISCSDISAGEFRKLATDALSSTTAEAGQKVQGLVEALEMLVNSLTELTHKEVPKMNLTMKHYIIGHVFLQPIIEALAAWKEQK